MQTTYTFETSTDCWIPVPANGAPASIITAYGLSTLEHHGGNSSFYATINNTSGAAANINLTLNYATPQNLTNATITMYVWVDTSLVNPTAWQTNIQPFDNGSNGFKNVWHEMNQGTDDARWEQITYTVGAQGDDPTNITAIGLQLGNLPAGVSGNIYIDDVQITYAATPTNTPTLTSTPTSTNTPTQTWSPTSTDTPTWTSTPVPGITDITSSIDGTCTTGDTTGGVDTYNETIGATTYGQGAPDSAYLINLNQPTNLYISLCGAASWSPVLYLRTNPSDPSTTINFDQTSASCGDGAPSFVTGVLQPGIYYIIVDGVGTGNYGAYNLCLSTFNPTCSLTPVAAPIPLGSPSGTTDLGTVTVDAVGTGHVDVNFEETNTWTFTPATAGPCTISLDCFDDTTNKVQVQYTLWDSGNNLIATSNGNDPLDQLVVDLTVQQYTVVVIDNWLDEPSGDYRLVVQVPPAPTSTPTATVTPTPTATICNPATIQMTYTFATSTDCWHADAGSPIVQNISLSTAQVYTGSTNSLAVSINNSGSTNQNAQVEVTYASSQNLAGAIISMWVYVDASLKTLPDWTTALDPFAQDPWTDNWTALGPVIPTNTWYNLSVTIGAGGTSMNQFGLQVQNVGPGASGNVYIDNVQITFPIATNTPTATATSGGANTSTPTQTATTPVSCSAPSIQTTYTFETSTDCWDTEPANGAPAGDILSYGLSTLEYHGGTSSYFTTIHNTSATAAENFNITLNYATAQNLSNALITMWVWVDTSLVNPNAWQTNIQPFDNGSAGFKNVWHEMNQGTDDARWVQITYTVGAQGDDPTNITAIGLQLGQVPPGASGNIYIDDVTITYLPTPTPTMTPTSTDTPVLGAPTATPTNTPIAVTGEVWTFEDNAIDGWYVAYPSDDSVAVTNITTFGGTTDTSTYGLDIVMAGNENDVQAEVNSGPSGATATLPINFQLYNLTGVSCQAWFNSDLWTGNTNVFTGLYVKANGKAYGGTYGLGATSPQNTWINNPAGTYPYNGWNALTFAPSGGTWATDNTNVTTVGIEVNLGGSVPGDFVIDNVQLY